MFEIVNLRDSHINEYVFLTDVESIENQLLEIYEELKDNLGDSFSIIIDTFLRTGYDYNRFIEIKYNQGKYVGSLIVNYRDIPFELKKKSEELLRNDISLLDDSLLSKRNIEIVKSQLSV
jgi:hypothetical protein